VVGETCICKASWEEVVEETCKLEEVVGETCTCMASREEEVVTCKLVVEEEETC